MDAGRRTWASRLNCGVPWGTREPERLGTAGLLQVVARCRVAPAGGSRNLWHSCGECQKVSVDSQFYVQLWVRFLVWLQHNPRTISVWAAGNSGSRWGQLGAKA